MILKLIHTPKNHVTYSTPKSSAGLAGDWELITEYEDTARQSLAAKPEHTLPPPSHS